MEKTLMGLVAAIGAVAPLAGAHASVVSSEEATRALHVNSIAELLEPVANSSAILAALDSSAAQARASQEKDVQVAWYHHHHHHHHNFYHHHHHHNFYHHHHHHYYYHHHHHHHHYYRQHNSCIWTPVGWICP